MAFCNNLTTNQQFALCDTKFLCLCPKALPKGKGEDPLAVDLSCRLSFSLLYNAVECLLGYQGEKEGGVSFSTHGKKVMKCAFTAMIFVSADSMPCSLCCETYNHSLRASLHSTGLHLRVGILVVELHNRWKKGSRSSQILRRCSSLCCAAACFLSCPTVHSKQWMSHCNSSLAAHRWLTACENLLKSLAEGRMFVTIMLHSLRNLWGAFQIKLWAHSPVTASLHSFLQKYRFGYLCPYMLKLTTKDVVCVVLLLSMWE